MGLFGLWGGHKHERMGYMLYGAAVAAARDPFLYVEVRVPDTLDGRFDLIGLQAFLLIRHLRALPEPGPDLAQAVFDAMFNDMDVGLREIGVGDLSVGKKVRVMWEAFHGRATVYDAALASSDPAVLEAALLRNVWRGGPAPVLDNGESAASVLARIARAQDAHLSRQGLDALRRGQVSFLAAGDAAPLALVP